MYCVEQRNEFGIECERIPLDKRKRSPEGPCVQIPRDMENATAGNYQFSVTSGTIFDNRKRPIRDYLLAIALFTNGAKGISALQLSRDLNCQYRTAFVLAHKFREAIAAEQDSVTLEGPSRLTARISPVNEGAAQSGQNYRPRL
jgi:hypothetical protein